MQPTYDPEAVKPMIQELTNLGVESLETADDVERFLANPGTAMLVINSVCGCAAGSCRPGVAAALQNGKIPDNLGTVFAGVQMESVQRARDLMEGVQPSSPNIALFKDGEILGILQRQHIEQMTAEDITAALVKVFDEQCDRQGPSVAPEVADENESVKSCGSSIPLYTEE